MKTILAAAAVLNQTPLDWEGNERHIRQALERSREAGVGLLCLPELCITGYGCEDAFHAPETARRAWDVLMRLLPETKGLVVACGLPVFHRNALFNVAALMADGKLHGFVAKRFLAGDGIHYEPRWFKAWPEGVRDTLETPDGRFPIGDLHFDCGGVRIGFEICEDAWVANRPGATLALQGIDVILNPSASHFAFGKIDVRRRFVLEGSRAFGVSYVYANLLGNEAGRAIYDGGALIASGGRMLAEGPRFGFHDLHLTFATLDVDRTRMSQARTASFRPRVGTDTELCVTVAFEFAGGSPTPVHPPAEAWETGGFRKEEEFTRAVILGLFDYLRKSRSNGFVVSLSGGADSAAVACLVALMARRAWKELGEQGLRAKLGYCPEVAAVRNVEELTRTLLACVYQASANSTTQTRDAARQIADALYAAYDVFDIAPLVDGYCAMVEKAIGRRLDWATDDTTLQNIQARVRAPGVWMLANLRNALLLATSNRSEAAVGYATMDGDTCGGLSPIAGIDKAFLRHWLRWLETQGPEGFAPIPALECVNRQAPTAELRPAERHQTDEDDLMPYDVLDAIEKAAIRDKMAPKECWDTLVGMFPNHTPRELRCWVVRFFRLWCRNQWKRERYAPSFHLDDENLDPKTWCRFPILSGGYRVELGELEAMEIAEEGRQKKS